MSDHVYKLIELTGTSTEGVEAAVNSALDRAGKTLHNLRWFEVTNIRGDVADNNALHWQVTLKAGFKLD
jgi:dodecin